MPYGFGPTLGTGTADEITNALTPTTGQRSYFIRVTRNGVGGGGFGRFFGADDSTTQFEGFFWNSSSGYISYQRSFTATATWGIPPPADTTAEHSYAVVLNLANEAAPAIYLDGIWTQTTVYGTARSGTQKSISSSIHLGNRSTDSARNLDGIIHQFVVYDGKLTSQQVADLDAGADPLSNTGWTGGVKPTNTLLVNMPLVTDATDTQGNTTTVSGAQLISSGPSNDVVGDSTSFAASSGTGEISLSASSGLAASSTDLTATSGTGAITLPMAIQDDYDRSSVILASSSISGTGDSAVISIAPKVQESEVNSSQTRWLEPSARITGMNGKRPTFKFLSYAATAADGKYHGAPWQSTRRPMFSYNRYTWFYFDTQTINTNDITFRHNSAFTSDVVYIGRSRQLGLPMIGQLIYDWSVEHASIVKPPAAAVAFTPSLTVGWPAQFFIVDEYSPQTDSLGNTIEATPLYEFKIQDDTLSPALGGPKKLAFFWGGVHAGEDHSEHCLLRFIEVLLGNSADAIKIRSEYVIHIFPCINAPGRHGGGWRGSWTQGTSGADDANRHATETTSGLEIVDKPRAAMLLEMSGTAPDIAIGWHGAFSYNWGFYTEAPNSATWRSTLAANSGFTVTDFGGSPNGKTFPDWFLSLGTRWSTDLEHGDVTPISDANMVTWGGAVAATIVDLIDLGAATNLTGAATTSTAASSTAGASQTHALVALGCAQTPTSSTAAVSASMTMGASTSSATATSSTGSIASTPQLSGTASTFKATSASGALTQNQVTAAAATLKTDSSGTGAISRIQTLVGAATVSTPTSAPGSLAPTHNTTGAATSASSSSSTAGITQTVNLTPQQTSQTPAASTAPISLIKTFIAAITVSTPDSGSGAVGIIGAGQLVGSTSATSPSSASGSISQIQQLVPGQCAVAVASPQASVTQNQILAAAYTAIYPFLSTGIWNGEIVPEPPLFARVVLSVAMHRRITFSVNLK